MRKVVFEPGSAIADVPFFYLSPGANLSVAVASHVTKTARKLKRGEWFVHVDRGQQSGHLFFRGKSNTLPFRVEGKD